MPIEFHCPHCGHGSVADDRFAGGSGPCAVCGRRLTLPAAPSAAYASEVGSGVKRPRPLAMAAVLAVSLWCIIPILMTALNNPRDPVWRIQCHNHLRQVSLAVLNYESRHGSLPPAYTVDDTGRPLHSWRTLLLPYLEHKHLYDQLALDEPWDSPHNRQFHDRFPRIYDCPGSSGQSNETSYMVVVGDETAFPPGGEARRLSDLTDGPSNTILVVEVKNAGTHWMEPVDLQFDQLAFRIGEGEIDSHHSGLAHVVLADGAAHALPANIRPANLRAMLTAAAGDRVVWSEVR